MCKNKFYLKLCSEINVLDFDLVKCPEIDIDLFLL